MANEIWTSKIGVVGKHLRLGLRDASGLVDFAGLSGPGGSGAPQLRMRLRGADTDTAISRDVIAYTDSENDPDLYNAEVVFSDFTGIVAGVYLCEVDAHQGGEDVTFPAGSYFLIRFRSGVD
jgi:hypothetical protein